MQTRPENIRKRSVPFNEYQSFVSTESFKTRLISGCGMISIFLGIVAAGPIPIALLIFAIQIIVFKEVISVAHIKSVERRIPWFRTTTW